MVAVLPVVLALLAAARASDGPHIGANHSNLVVTAAPGGSVVVNGGTDVLATLDALQTALAAAQAQAQSLANSVSVLQQAYSVLEAARAARGTQLQWLAALASAPPRIYVGTFNSGPLTALSGYSSVTGSVIINAEHPAPTLAALPSLVSVGDGFYINSAPQLTLAVLPALVLVSGAFSVASSTLLTYFASPVLLRVDGAVIVQASDALAAFDMPALTYAGCCVEVSGCPALAVISLPSLRVVAGALPTGTAAALFVSGNAQLTLLAAPALTSVSGSVVINSNNGAFVVPWNVLRACAGFQSQVANGTATSHTYQPCLA